MSNNIRLGVVSGQRRLPVGSIEPRVGMRTSVGNVTRVSGQTVYVRDDATGKSRGIRNLSGVTVAVSEARKFGYGRKAALTS